jgi:hypothetical protein
MRGDHMRHITVDACDCTHDAASKHAIDKYFDELMVTAKKIGSVKHLRKFFNRTDKPEKTRSQVLLDVEFLT